jgi:hypothetical protein
MASRSHKARTLAAGALLLLALLFRATVPVGFMPSGEGPFALQICPEGMPSGAHAEHLHHGANHGHFEHCPFGSVPGAGPVSHAFGIAALPPAAPEVVSEFSAPHLAIRLERAHAARAPPALI